MPTSRPIRRGEWLTWVIETCGVMKIGGNHNAIGTENPVDVVLQEDFHLLTLEGDPYVAAVNTRVFGVPEDSSDRSRIAAVANGTAPGLYVRESDDTSNLEAFLAVLRQRRDEAVAARRGEAAATGQPGETATRQDDEIRVGDVVEVVTCNGSDTARVDIGCVGRVCRIDRSFIGSRIREQVYLDRLEDRPLPTESRVSLSDVRKVASSPSPSITVATNIPPIPVEEVERITGAVAVEVQRPWTRVPLPNLLRDNSVVDDLDSDDRPDPAIQALIDQVNTEVRSRMSQPLGNNQGAARFFTNTILPTPPARSGQRPSPPQPVSPPQPTPSPSQPQPPPSRFQLLEVDASPSPPQQAPKASVGLAALQTELRAEREAKRALAASQTPPGRFDLLECDLPAVPVVVKQAKVASSTPPPRPTIPRPVETITDLTTARSPRELMRMLEGLNDELTTMMRQREAN